jgi:acetyl-CoA carboxylase biotin carboxyl carrier protein
MIDISLVEKLIELLNKSDAQTIEIKKKFWTTTIRVSKNSALPTSGPVTYQVSAAPPSQAAMAAPAEIPAPPAPPAPPQEAEGAARAVSLVELTEIKSPMVGTFYAQPEPGADPYVQVGGRVSVGQTLCIIEAMKIMNPLDAEVSGVIKEVAVQDSQPVEFGQVLFRVAPNG